MAAGTPEYQRLTVAGLLIAVACLSVAADARAQGAYSGSVYVSRASADGSETTALFWLNGVDVEWRRLRLAAMVPLVSQRTTWVDTTTGSQTVSGWESGLGDPMFRGDVEAWRSRSGRAALRMSGTVKVPMASVDSGRSSGATDTAVGISWFQSGPRGSLLTDVTYWVVGDTPETDFRDSLGIYVGYGRILDQGRRWSALVSAGVAQAAVTGVRAPAQVTIALLRLLRPNAALGISCDIGLTDGAADLALASSWRIRF
jgi:hypothetical protein